MNNKAKELGETLVNAVTIENEDGTIAVHGLNLREYFAGLAMQGLLDDYGVCDSDTWQDKLAAQSVKAADALLAELNKEE
jgi:hypothetical protein